MGFGKTYSLIAHRNQKNFQNHLKKATSAFQTQAQTSFRAEPSLIAPPNTRLIQLQHRTLAGQYFDEGLRFGFWR